MREGAGEERERATRRSSSFAPLLFIAGGADNIMPPSVNRSNAKHYKSSAITEYQEFPGRSHYTIGEDGWEAVADYGLSWAIERTKERTVTPSLSPARDTEMRA